MSLVALYVWRLTDMTQREILRSDYLIYHTAGTIVRRGLGSQLYVDQVQGAVYGALAAGDHAGDLLFNHAPLSAVLAVPVSLVSPAMGHMLWSLVQLALLASGCILVARAAPWPAGTYRRTVIEAVLVALAGAGTLPLLLQGQGVGELAFASGAAYWLWRRDRWMLGSAVLVFGAGVDKPHLALGLIAFMVGMRNRRVILGALAGGTAAIALSLTAVGIHGVTGFVADTIRSLTLYPASAQDGFTGLFTSLLGAGGPAYLASAICIVAAIVGCVALGNIARRDHSRLELAWIAASGLSLVAAPHVLAFDLAMLAPPFVAGLAVTARGDPRRASRLRRRRLIELWIGLLVASGIDTVVPTVLRLTPIAVLLVVWQAWLWMRTSKGTYGARVSSYSTS